MTGGHIVVVGDVMLDVFSEGRVDRLSPEAPIPILHNPVSHEVLGGGANTARNIRTLGEAVRLIGYVGNDSPGRTMITMMAKAGVENSVQILGTWPTIVKGRFLGGGQQILRVDQDSPLPVPEAETLIPRLEGLLAGAKAVVLSDYDKGAISDGVARRCVSVAQAISVPCVADTKRLDPDVYSGCTVLTPNLMEATRMSGTPDPGAAAARIAAATGSAVLLTLGADGMLLHQNGTERHIHSRAQDVADVTGAGDSVTAGLAVALVRGHALEVAAQFANQVAAVAVAHKGTYAVTARDVADWSPETQP